MAIKNILVPVDFSEPSLRALDYAVGLAKPTRARLTVLYVVEPIAYASPADLYAGVATQLGDLITEQRRGSRKKLGEIQEKLAKKGIKSDVVLREGLAHQEIVATAAKAKADMIVLATHGRTGLSHLLMGSVAERVVRTAPCPVLSLRGEVIAAPKKKAGKRPAK